MASHDAGVAVARGGFAAGRVGTCSRRVVLEPEQAEQLELDDGEVPLQQQHVRADGGGEAELDGQEQRNSGVEERGLADGSDGAAARRALSWRAGRREVRVEASCMDRPRLVRAVFFSSYPHLILCISPLCRALTREFCTRG